MSTRLIHAVATALAADGMRAVRFDVRGAGRSEGRHGDGRGAADDAAAVLAALLAEAGRPVALVGFSFGGAVALRLAATHADIERLVCIATPVRLGDEDLAPLEDAAHVQIPVFLVHGTRDTLVSRADADELAAALPAAPQWHVVDGADHFLTAEHVPRAVDAVRRALAAGRS